MKEKFNDIPGWEGRYKASNMGRIKSLGNDKGRKEKILKTRKNGLYEKLYLCKGGRRFDFYVYRLVWEAFNGPIPEGMVINHMDENPANNRLDNLMVCTQKENCNWGTRNERSAASHKRNFQMKLKDLGMTEDEYRKMKAKEASDRQRERCRKKAAEKRAAMLKSLGLTEEEYLMRKEEERKEKAKAYRKKYYEANKKKIYLANKKWKNTHLEEVKAYHREYWGKNKEKYRAKKAF